MRKTGNKFDCIKLYRDKKAQDLQKIFLVVEIFVNVKHFGF